MKEGIAPNVPSADAVVFFGATEDLTHKTIFEAKCFSPAAPPFGSYH